MARATEILTWRRMAEIKNACDIEVALDSCVRIMRAALMMSSEVWPLFFMQTDRVAFGSG